MTRVKDNRGRNLIGSERKLGGADVHLGFEVVHPFGHNRTGLAKIVTHKDRSGPLPRGRAAELELRSDPESGAVEFEIKPAKRDAPAGAYGFRPTHLMQKGE